MDGETDWKVRIASPSCQSRASLDEVSQFQNSYVLQLICINWLFIIIIQDVLSLGISITVEAPKPDIYSFCGTLSIVSLVL